MTTFALIPFIAWILVFFVTVYVYAQPRSDALHRAFLLTALVILGWISLELLAYLPLSKGREMLVLKSVAFFWIPSGVVFLNFIYRLLGRPLDRFFSACVVLAAIGVGVDISTDWCLNGFERRYWGLADLRGPWHSPMALVPSLPTVVGLWLVLRARRRVNPLLAHILNLVLVGGAVGFSTAMTLNMALPNFFQIDFLPRFGSSALGLFCLAIYVAVRRHDFLTVSVEQVAEEIFALSLDGLVLLDQDDRVARLNPAAKSLLRLTDSESFPDLETRPTAQSLLPGLERALASQVVSVGRDTGERFYSVSRTVLSTWDKRHRGEILVLRDITVFKQAEQVLRRSKEELEAEVQRRTEELRQAQKMEEIGRLAGGVAHDFNNQLAVIIGFATAAHDDLDPSHPIREDLQEILQAADNGRSTIQQLLAFSRKAKAPTVPVDLGKTVEDALRLFSVSLPPSIQLRSAIGEPTYRVRGDSTALQQVFINLLSNATDAIGDTAGIIEIRIEPAQLDTAVQTGRIELPPGAYLRLEVKDNGCGMSPAVLERLFEPFFTTKPTGEGTGLGLSTALGIVESHGGSLSVTSAEKVGSTFTILLPRLSKDHTPLPPPPTKTEPPGGAERILIVDDEKRVLRGTRRMVEQLGYHVESVANSLEALELLRASPHRYDLVITDQVMPGLSGLELAGLVHEVRRDLPVILLSGFSNSITDTSLTEAAIAAFLHKPVGKSELAQAIREVLDAARPSAGG